MPLRFHNNPGRPLLVLALLSSTTLAQQVTEQDTRVTGPRGRTIERDIRTIRGPGYVERQVEIKRPGETIIRDTRFAAPIGRPYPYRYGPPAYGPGPRFFAPPPVFSTFVGVPGFSLFLGNPAPPPPPPPVIVAYPPEPAVVVAQPPPPASPPPAFDPLAEHLAQLKSLHSNHRRDAALACGNLRDARAVPALNHALEHDIEKEVRVAAAYALGEIGDLRATLPLEKAMLYDKRHDVREAAKLAYARLPKPGQGPAPVAGPRGSAVVRQPSPMTSTPANENEVDPGPPPTTTRPVEDTPPPPPVPSTPPPIPPGLEPPR